MEEPQGEQSGSQSILARHCYKIYAVLISQLPMSKSLKVRVMIMSRVCFIVGII